SFDEASLVEPLACCIRAWKKCRFQKGDDVVILGAGPTGVMHMLLAQAFGAGKIFVIDINDFRLDFAKKYSMHVLNSISNQNFVNNIRAETGGRGADVCIIATGNMQALLQSFDLTRKGGEIVLFGVPPKGSQMSYDMSKIYSSEHTLIPSYAASEIETNQALKLIAEGRIDVGSLITHRFHISEAAEAIKCAHEANNAMKVIITTD
ncbi:MAG: zinc-binding dehydrogenase, partial [Thermoproteota archaeon]|nr:zinc-binding dehydrogenase [Thermoproteota archaeon]